MENFRLGAYQSRTQFLLFKKDFLGDTLAVARPHVCVFFSTSYKPSFLTSFYIGPACGPRRVVSLVVPDNKAALEAARGVAQTSICAVFPDPGGHVRRFQVLEESLDRGAGPVPFVGEAARTGEEPPLLSPVFSSSLPAARTLTT